MNTHRKHLIVSVVAAAGLLLGVACSGSSDDGGVASLAEDGAAQSESVSLSAKETENQLIEYTQCLRDQGLDIGDPEVDADGNLRMGRPRLNANTGGAGGGGAGFNRDRFEEVQKACGEPPAGAGFGFSGGDQSAFQDTLVKFAECMRGQGVDMPDPEFSGATGGGGGAGGLFSSLNSDDPAVAAAREACQGVFAGSAFGQNGGQR